MGRRILVVDDEQLIAGSIADILTADGHTVFCASSGIDALEQNAQHAPDTFITDFMMPLMDGMALIRELRSRAATANLPIVLMTAAPLSVAGADYDVLLTKPFSLRTLRAALQHAWTVRPVG